MRRLNPGVDVPEAVAYATGRPVPWARLPKPSNRPKPAVVPARPCIRIAARPPVRAADRPPGRPTPWQSMEAAKRLWSPEGRAALAYLERRGLTAETIRRHRLGWTPGVMLPKSDGAGYWRASGIVIPWLDGDRLANGQDPPARWSGTEVCPSFRRPPEDLSGPRSDPARHAADHRRRGVRRHAARPRARGTWPPS